VIRRADLTIVVSPIEVEVLRQIVPEAKVLLLSTIHEPMKGGRPLAEREGIVFIGSFQHPPTSTPCFGTRARFCRGVRKRLPGVKTFIVGSKVPSTIRALAAPDLVVTGYVPDVEPFFTDCRLSIAPLRYGAGVKGKVNLAMSYGVPVVATTNGGRGDAPGAGRGRDGGRRRGAVRIGHRARVPGRIAVAAAVAAGVENIRRHFSRAVAKKALQELFEMAKAAATGDGGRR